MGRDYRGFFETLVDDLTGTSQKEIDQKNDDYRDDQNGKDAQENCSTNGD